MVGASAAPPTHCAHVRATVSITHVMTAEWLPTIGTVVELKESAASG